MNINYKYLITNKLYANTAHWTLCHLMSKGTIISSFY